MGYDEGMSGHKANVLAGRVGRTAFLFAIVFIAHTGWITSVAHADETEEGQRWIKLAEQGDSFAQAQLGWMYLHGEGVTQDDEKAVFWTRKSAEQGYDLAQFNLGVMYDNGYGVAQDYEKALQWFQKAADQGDADAQYYLGWRYEKGEGVTQDYEKSGGMVSKSCRPR